MSGLADQVAQAYCAACLAELDALKPGNVHRFASGHGMDIADFERSAQVSAEPIARSGARIGARIRNAISATQAAVRVNTNLGIVLLCAPLAAAAALEGDDLRAALAGALNGLDLADADDTFAAIAQANPGGLGHAPSHDVNAPARVTLREAMAAAAGRDRIARQYDSNFEDIFTLGLTSLALARARPLGPQWATLAVYLTYLAAFPDTHISRKFGPLVAQAVQSEAAPWPARLAGAGDPAKLVAPLLEFDASLKARGLNPGTSADLTVATLFAETLAKQRRDHLALSPQQ